MNFLSHLHLFFQLGFFQTPPPIFETMSQNMQFFFVDGVPKEMRQAHLEMQLLRQDL